MKLIIFGAGNTGKELYSKIVNHKNVYGDTVIAFSDNNSKLWNTYEDTIPIISPIEIANYDYDVIVIASLYEREILNQLVESNQRDKIMLLNEYERKVYTHFRYVEHYGSGVVYPQKACNNKIVVYTSITGNYDELNEPLYVSSTIEYICFTNNRNLESKLWNVQYIEDKSLNNMYLAKKVKMFPDLFLKEYETSVWVDGKFQILTNIKEYIMKYQRSEPMLCFPHFSRSCIYEEAGRCIADGIGVKKDIIHQIACYEREGYPIDNGLYEMGCIVRNHNDDMVKRVMSSWWEEIQKYSYRDQISFPVVCWRNNFRPDICDQDIYKNKWLLCKRNYCKVK